MVSLTSAILYGAGICRYYARGQDGRVVKASFFCEIVMVTCGFQTRLQILSTKEVHIVRRDGFYHVRDSIWRRQQPIFWGGQDGRVVKASFFCEIAMVTRGFETRLQILSSKEVHIVRRDGFNHVRDSIWRRRHLPIF